MLDVAYLWALTCTFSSCLHLDSLSLRCNCKPQENPREAPNGDLYLPPVWIYPILIYTSLRFEMSTKLDRHKEHEWSSGGFIFCCSHTYPKLLKYKQPWPRSDVCNKERRPVNPLTSLCRQEASCSLFSLLPLTTLILPLYDSPPPHLSLSFSLTSCLFLSWGQPIDQSYPVAALH